MTSTKQRCYIFGCAITVLCVLSVDHASAQDSSRSTDKFRKPVYRVPRADADRQAPNRNPRRNDLRVAANNQVQGEVVANHPLQPLIQTAQAGLATIHEDISDYKATLAKREQVNGEIREYEYIFTKVRHQKRDANGNVTVPFSVYMRFLAPKSLEGREVIWVEGRNNGKMVAHEGGVIGLISVWIKPTSAIAMRGNRYPISDVGIENLLGQLIKRAQMDIPISRTEDFQIQTFPHAKVDGRDCTCIRIIHPQRKPHFDYYEARVFYDNELNVPIRYVAWDWPAQPGGRPVLLEEYTYKNLQLNSGLTDADFNHQNEKYNFKF